MKTQYNEIVNVTSIGKTDNPISMNEILRLANSEKLTPAHQNQEKILFLGIDVQQDFMDNGALGVPGAHGDVERMTKFIYDNKIRLPTSLYQLTLIHLIRSFIHAGGLMKTETTPVLLLLSLWLILTAESGELL